MTHFTAILTLLQLSGNELAVCLRYVCLYIFGIIKSLTLCPLDQSLLPLWLAEEELWILVSLNGSQSTCPCISNIHGPQTPRTSSFTVSHPASILPPESYYESSAESDVL